MDEIVISIRNLEKRYPSSDGDILALKDVNFDIAAGEFVSVIGPSGCGKSTLLRILAGLLEKTGGEVYFKNEPITGPQKGIGVVFQDPVLMPWRNVLENAMLPVEILGLDKKIYSERAMALLEMVGLASFRNKHTWELSGGMQQRLAIVRSLVTDPSVLLMDEPFAALDALTREQMNVELLRICAETQKTTFFITHNIAEAVFLSSRVVALSPRPGTVSKILEIDLPSRELQIIYTEGFGEYVKELNRHIKVERTY